MFSSSTFIIYLLCVDPYSIQNGFCYGVVTGVKIHCFFSVSNWLSHQHLLNTSPVRQNPGQQPLSGVGAEHGEVSHEQPVSAQAIPGWDQPRLTLQPLSVR